MAEAIINREGDPNVSTRGIIHARFRSHVREGLPEYFANVGTDRAAIQGLQTDLQTSVARPLTFPEYTIPPEIADNNRRVRTVMRHRARVLDKDTTAEQMTSLLVDQHDVWKIAQGRWLLANTRMMLEVEKAGTSMPQVGAWLEEEFGVGPEDDIILPHIIGNDSYPHLVNMGFNAPYNNLDVKYMEDSMDKARELAKSNPKNKGILLFSWIADPAVFEEASDGRSLVAFAPFPITGKGKEFGEATPDNEFSAYYHFATENPRRKALAETDAFTPRVFGIFLPRDEIVLAA
jgi:hypothetical protein